MLQKGQLKNIPVDIILKVLDEQERQGNKRNIKVFQNLISAKKSQGGFDWIDVNDGCILGNALRSNNPNIFYKYYPKQEAKLKVGDNLPGSGYEFINCYGSKGRLFCNSFKQNTIKSVHSHYYEVIDSTGYLIYYIKIEDVDKNVPMAYCAVTENKYVFGFDPYQIKDDLNKTIMKQYKVKNNNAVFLINNLLLLEGLGDLEVHLCAIITTGGDIYPLLNKHNLVSLTLQEIKEEQVFHIPFKVTVKDGKAYHESGEDITEFVTRLVRMNPHTISIGTSSGNREYVIEEVIFSKTGCEKVQTKLSDWKKVYNALNK